MGKKAIVVLLVGLALGFSPFSRRAAADKGTKDWLAWKPRSALAPARDVFERELRALGYVEGREHSFRV